MLRHIAKLIQNILILIFFFFLFSFHYVQRRNHQKSFTGVRYDKLNDREHLKPLNVDSRNTKLLISPDSDSEMKFPEHQYEEMLEGSATHHDDDEDEEDDMDEETRFISTDTNRRHLNSYYTSSERT